MMSNPSRTVVIWLTLIAIAGLVLGLATDVGLFGWSLSALLALYLAVVILTRFVRPRPSSNREPT
jgi:amino acid transporter